MAKRKMSTFERLRSGKKLGRRERRALERCLQADAPELAIVHPNAAGIDVGNESHFVGIKPGQCEQPVQEFGSRTADLRRMVEWLKSHGVKTVAMQSTGVYWIALYEVLEQAGFEVYLVNARGTKNLPGRKSDVQECQWLRKLHTYGLLRNSFRPPEEIRAVRTIWRLRDRHVQEAGRSVEQMQKALTTMNVQLANAITDLSGATGLAILRAILAGERDPQQLAKLRDARVQASEEEIAHSLEGNWREEVLFELQQVVDTYDFLQRQIAACDVQLQKYYDGSAHPRATRSPACRLRSGGGRGRSTPEESEGEAEIQECPELRFSRGTTAHDRGGFADDRGHQRHDRAGDSVGDGSGFECVSHRIAFHGLVGAGPAAGHQRGEGDRPKIAAGQESGRQRLTHGGRVSFPQRLVPGGAVSPSERPVGRTESGQSHGPLLGLFSVPTAY